MGSQEIRKHEKSLYVENYLDPRAHTSTFAEGCPATPDGGAGNSGRRELLAHVHAPCWQTMNGWLSE